MNFVKFFLIFTLTLESTVAFGKAPQCEHVFFPTVFEVLLQTQQKNQNFLLGVQNFQEFTQNYSWLRRRKIRKILQSVELQNFTSEAAIQRYTAELSIALFGPRALADRWITRNKSERLEESAVLLIKEQILQEGLLNIWKDQHNPKAIGRIKKSFDLLSGLHQTKWAFLQLPWSLPQLPDSRISPELMSLVIRDGFKAHAEQIKVALKAQDRIEAYNAFRGIYGAVFFTSVVGLQILQAYQMIEWEQQRLVQEALKELKQTQESLQNLDLIKENLIEDAYQASLKLFKDRWGEDPTPAEAKALRLKIETLVKENN